MTCRALALALFVTGCGLDLPIPQSPYVVQGDADGQPLTTRMLKLERGLLQIRVGEQRPKGRPVGDVLYFHGFADRLDNHGPLFEAWNKAGLRVISFDLPSHGENRGLKNKLDLYSFEKLSDVAKAVERFTREDAARPLIVSGWSTGGLLAVRMAQTQAWQAGDRPLKGLVLMAPGVSPRPVMGDKGVVTQETLTRNPNPPHMGPLVPQSPLLTPVFTSKMLANALLSQVQDLPKLPTLVMTAGDDEDRYVETDGIKKWSQIQRLKNRVPLVGLQFEAAFHELDNEPGKVGFGVRLAAAAFAAAVARGSELPSLQETEAIRF